MIHPRTLHSLEFDKVVAYLESLCISSAGRILAAATKPLENADEAARAFSMLAEYQIWVSSPTNIKFTLTAYPDVAILLDNLGLPGQSSPDLDAFWALRQMLREAKKAHDSLCDAAHCQHWPHLHELAQSCDMPEQLIAALNRCISDDGYLKDESSPGLYRLRNELRALHQGCLRKVRDYAQQYNMLPYLQDEFMTLSSDRYVLPLKANFKGRMQGIIHDWSQTGETCYFEPMFLVEINNRLQELKHEEREEERKIIDYLAGLLNDALPGARAANSLLARIDLLNAKKLLADYLDCASPTFSDADQGIELLAARHPLLALSRQETGEKPRGDRQNPVRPLDIILRPGDRVLVITGGNAGGKTVCLKTMGLLAVMAMSGLPISAASGSHLPWFDRVDAFIGDEQSLDDNVSTFTAQIDHLSKAWKYLDGHGLALLDEFGAGTDPAEGAALAQAVLDGLLDKKCFVLAATHFPALKSYALTKAGVRAASMLFTPDTGRPMFKIAYDQVGSSQALHVAQAHGMPEEILARARHYLLQDGQDPDAIMGRLNAIAAEREAEIEALKAERARADSILADKREKLDRERARLNGDVRAKISELMHAWKSGRANARQTIKQMSGLREELGLGPIEESPSVLPEKTEFKIGQTVLHTRFNRRGVIRDVDGRKKRVRLDMNGVSLWADMKDLRDSIGSSREKTGTASKSIPTGGGSLSLDVRGMRADEAIAEIERFLDRAILAGFGEVEIVHGRGTGALRRQIHDFLRTFPAISSFALAPEDRGGDGMTIVSMN